MNKYENILVDTVGRIKESFGGEALRNGKRLQGLCMDMSPQLMNQREYKMLVILIKCGGNEALLDALNDTPAAQERAVVRLTQRMADEYVMDETAARRICALYMTAASGNSAYIDRLDAAGEAKRQPAPKPAPAPTPKSAPAVPPTPKTAPSSTPKPAPAPTPTPKPAPKPAPAPATEPKPQKTPGAPRLKLKNRRLRFVPVVIAMLGGYIVLEAALCRGNSAGFEFAAADIMRIKVFGAVYLPAVVYCYMIAFPFDGQFTWLKKMVMVVRAVFGDLAMAFFLAYVGSPLALFLLGQAGMHTAEAGSTGDILALLETIGAMLVSIVTDSSALIKTLGLMLLVVAASSAALRVNFLIHGYPIDKDKTPPEYQDWLREDEEALSVMFKISLIVYLGVIVIMLIGA